jgi:oligopeptide/dipeptide ABC transporter ATP-binding protein
MGKNDTLGLGSRSYNSSITKKGIIRAVDGVSLQLERGNSLGLIGESGCGKSTIVKSLFRILERNGQITGGKIKFENEDLVAMDERHFNSILWEKIALIPQSSMSSFNPVYKVSSQIFEAIEIHREDAKKRKKEYLSKIMEYFSLVGLDPNLIDHYPHQFSGGMAQRAAISMAMILDPVLLVADEPTTALDVIIQDQILKNFLELREKFNSSILLVTHDISVVSEVCDHVAVMYAGKLVEYGSNREIFNEPLHPYTMGLINAFADIQTSNKLLVSIPGVPPNLISPLSGCRFADRCPFKVELCMEEPGFIRNSFEDEHCVSCHRVDEAENLRTLSKDPEIWKTRKS